jgi:hypothetical protein
MILHLEYLSSAFIKLNLVAMFNLAKTIKDFIDLSVASEAFPV